jgi:hypothetical protein
MMVAAGISRVALSSAVLSWTVSCTMPMAFTLSSTVPLNPESCAVVKDGPPPPPNPETTPDTGGAGVAISVQELKWVGEA